MAARAGTSPQQRREVVEQRLAAAQEVLVSAVAELRSGDDWRRYLSVQARMHSYSPNNVLLIMAQHEERFRSGMVASPDPGWVAGFSTWKALGRSVERGQRGYMVLAPCRYERRLAVSGDGNVRTLRHHEVAGEGERTESRRVMAGFRVEHVFSVHQTAGQAISAPPMPVLLEGAAPVGLRQAVERLLEGEGFTVASAASASEIGGANGVTRWDNRTVTVRSDMDDAAVAKTLLHEAGHVLLHQEPPGSLLPRGLKEVEAESVAFVVAAVHGMSSDGYTFPYVAAWAGSEGVDAIRRTQSRVAEAAGRIIAASPAEHGAGGRPPGAVGVAVAAGRRSTKRDFVEFAAIARPAEVEL